MKMKKCVHIYSVVLISLLIIGGGCVKQTHVEEERAKTTKPTVENNEDLTLLDLPVDREIIPAKYPVQRDVIGNNDITIKQESEIVSDTESVAGLIEQIPIEADSVNNQAFRIQIFTSKVFGEARHARQIAEEIFDRPVYLDYEVPYFKVRVGSFRNRDDAEQYLPRVRAAGYTDAWVVMTMVSVHEAAPLYLEEQPVMQEDSTDGQYESPEEQ